MVTDQQDWHVTIVDFGLSRVFPQSLDGSRTGIKAAGTTSTAAPEVIRGEEYLMVSDVWSIGAMVYRLVGDRDPFLRDDRRDDPKALRRLEAGDCDWGRIATMSRPGRAFVFKCLRPHPALRWAADAALKYCV
jgi:serine/threonine protein kinase